MKLFKLMLLSGLTLTSLAARADPRANAVQKATDLQSVASDLADLVQYECGCPNTANSLFKIVDIAIDVELEARFGTALSAGAKMKGIVREVIRMRQFTQHIDNRPLRTRIKRELSIAVNELGRAIFGHAWIPVYREAILVDGVFQETEVDVQDQNLDATPEPIF